MIIIFLITEYYAFQSDTATKFYFGTFLKI